MYITRGLNNQGKALESDVREAIQQCESAGAKVISLSLAGSRLSTPMQRIVERLYRKGFLIFAAAGNGASNQAAYPASHPDVISVTAVSEDRQVWSGSNWGGWLELAAPGVLITSTTIAGGSYTYANYTGTSMATPHVSFQRTWLFWRIFILVLFKCLISFGPILYSHRLLELLHCCGVTFRCVQIPKFATHSHIQP
jgi:subtilisin family serine protease